MLPRAAIPASHDPSIVVLSVIVSIAGACAAVHLVERLRNVKGRAWAAWFAGAAAVDGMANLVHIAGGSRLPAREQAR